MGGETLNDTSAFYTGESPSLFWEMTVCQSLADPAGTAARALSRPRPYGRILAEFLFARLSLGPESRVVEVGGGYGTLMERFLEAQDVGSVLMVDLSPRFSALQRERLGGRNRIEFLVSDVFAWLQSGPDPVDLVISNENIGDFPTLAGLDAARLRDAARRGPPFGEDPAGRAARLVHRYGLDLPEEGELAFNLGALEYVERLAPVAKAVFLSEHSADAAPPAPWDFLQTEPNRRPRRIPLKDHDEYSIRFDHLAAVGRGVGYRTERLSMPEFLGLRVDEGARFLSRVECAGIEGAEALHEFLNHVKEYECLLLTR